MLFSLCVFTVCEQLLCAQAANTITAVPSHANLQLSHTAVSQLQHYAQHYAHTATTKADPSKAHRQLAASDTAGRFSTGSRSTCLPLAAKLHWPNKHTTPYHT
jgi:hypothetical protein